MPTSGRSLPVAQQTLALLKQRYAKHREDRESEAFAAFAAELAFCSDASAAIAAIAEADVRSFDLLEEYFLNWMLVLDPAAKLYAARLTATYVTEKAVRDPFLRRVGELLRSAEGEELQILVELFARVGEALRRAAEQHPTEQEVLLRVLDDVEDYSVNVLSLGACHAHAALRPPTDRRYVKSSQ